MRRPATGAGSRFCAPRLDAAALADIDARRPARLPWKLGRRTKAAGCLQQIAATCPDRANLGFLFRRDLTVGQNGFAGARGASAATSGEMINLEA